MCLDPPPPFLSFCPLSFPVFMPGYLSNCFPLAPTTLQIFCDVVSFDHGTERSTQWKTNSDIYLYKNEILDRYTEVWRVCSWIQTELWRMDHHREINSHIQWSVAVPDTKFQELGLLRPWALTSLWEKLPSSCSFGTLMWDDDQTKDTNGFVIFWQLCPCLSQQAMSLAQGI